MTLHNRVPAAESPLLDQAYLEELKRHLGAEIAKDILADGVLALTDRVGGLADAARSAPDPEGTLAQLAHDIVGTAGQLGLHRVVHAARLLERKAIARADTLAHQQNLLVLADRSLAAMAEYLGEVAEDPDSSASAETRPARSA